MIKYHTIVLTDKKNTYTISTDLRKYTEFRLSSVIMNKYENRLDSKCNYFIIESDGGFITEKINNKGVLAHFETTCKRISASNFGYTLNFSYNNLDLNDWTKIGKIEYDKKITINIRTLVPYYDSYLSPKPIYDVKYRECYIKLQLR